MKTDPATLISSTKLAALVKKHAPADLPPAPSDPIGTLVQSFLLWEASTGHASTALERISKDCVDFNELRVCLPEEIQVFLGMRYPALEERVDRLRRTLNDLYRREHKLSLAHVASAGKREQRTYIENLDGMLPFVASRVLLLHFEQPGVPVDDQLVDLLVKAKVLAKEMPAVELSHALAKLHASLEESIRLHHALVAFADQEWTDDPKGVHKLKVARHQAIEAARREAQKVLESKLRAEAKAKADAEAKAKAEAEAKIKAEAKAKADAEAKVKADKAKAIAMAKAEKAKAAALVKAEKAKVAALAKAEKAKAAAAAKAARDAEKLAAKRKADAAKAAAEKAAQLKAQQKAAQLKAQNAKAMAKKAAKPSKGGKAAKPAVKPAVKPAARSGGKSPGKPGKPSKPSKPNKPNKKGGK